MEPTRSVRPFEVISEYIPSGDQPQAIAELAARLRIPIGSVRVLTGDLVADGTLEVHQGVTSLSTDVALLKRLIHGVRAL